MAMSNSVKADGGKPSEWLAKLSNGGKPSEWLAKLSKLLKKAFGKYSFVFACTAT